MKRPELSLQLYILVKRGLRCDWALDFLESDLASSKAHLQPDVIGWTRRLVAVMAPVRGRARQSVIVGWRSL